MRAGSGRGVNGGLTLPARLGLPGDIPRVAHTVVLLTCLDDAELGVVRENAGARGVQARDAWRTGRRRCAGELRSGVTVEAHTAGAVPLGDVVAPRAY